jgi:hypothetical protein
MLWTGSMAERARLTKYLQRLVGQRFKKSRFVYYLAPPLWRPHQYSIVAAPSLRIARINSSSTSKLGWPLPSVRLHRGQEMGASVQLVTITSQSR